ncbi:MAG: hypothetical protein ACI883_000997, partial [Candidatus Azotimanducaceae bacterium]
NPLQKNGMTAPLSESSSCADVIFHSFFIFLHSYCFFCHFFLRHDYYIATF